MTSAEDVIVRLENGESAEELSAVRAVKPGWFWGPKYPAAFGL